MTRKRLFFRSIATALVFVTAWMLLSEISVSHAAGGGAATSPIYGPTVCDTLPEYYKKTPAWRVDGPTYNYGFPTTADKQKWLGYFRIETPATPVHTFDDGVLTTRFVNRSIVFRPLKGHKLKRVSICVVKSHWEQQFDANGDPIFDEYGYPVYHNIVDSAYWWTKTSGGGRITFKLPDLDQYNYWDESQMDYFAAIRIDGRS